MCYACVCGVVWYAWCMHVCTCVCGMHVCMLYRMCGVCVCVCVCVCVYVCVCVCVCVCGMQWSLKTTATFVSYDYICICCRCHDSTMHVHGLKSGSLILLFKIAV